VFYGAASSMRLVRLKPECPGPEPPGTTKIVHHFGPRHFQKKTAVSVNNIAEKRGQQN